MSEARDIRLRLQLAGGHTQELTLAEDAPELRDLFAALAGATAADALIQLPLEGGRVACSFRTSQIVSVASEPPVLVEPQVAEPATALCVRRSRYLVIDDFLSPAEHADLLLLATASEEHFETGTVAGDAAGYRQNLAIPGFGDSAHARLLQNRILVWYPLLARSLGLSVVPLGEVESQLTAARSRQFYKVHADAGPNAPRELSCIYYMHRQPRGFAGGELRLYDAVESDGERRAADTFAFVEPRANRLVAFRSDEFHEAMPVRCPSGDFADSRFAVTTWLHRAAQPDPEARFGWGHFRCGRVAAPCLDAGEAEGGGS
jgi:Rps23 Pro-64 3,4-dihydroxylase Tpa1-like proline 4-hydroxylase